MARSPNSPCFPPHRSCRLMASRIWTARNWRWSADSSIPYGGLLRLCLAAGETVVVNGATGAYGSAAVLVALAMGAGRGRRCGPQRRQASRPRTSRRPGGRSSCFVGRCPEGRCCSARRRGWRRGDGLRHGRRREGFRLDLGGWERAPSPRPTSCLWAAWSVALPVPYLQLMINSLDIIGNFMYPADAYKNVARLGARRQARSR